MLDEQANKEEMEQRVKESMEFVENPKRYNLKCKICGKIFSGNIDGSGFCPDCLNDPVEMLKYIQSKPEKEDIFPITDYKKIRLIGSGGMGKVWLVEDKKTGKQMGLKMMLPATESTEKERNLFLREAYIGGQLKHDKLVRQFELGYSSDTFYILMEYCRGGNIEDLMARNRNIFMREDFLNERIKIATHILLQMLDGLHYLHHAPVESKLVDYTTRTVEGVVHRDIRPENILLSDDTLYPDVKIADFGIAKAFLSAGESFYTVGEKSDMSTGVIRGEFRGDPMFVPRQQILDYRFVYPEVDVWAAAACYYYMLTGGVPPKGIMKALDIETAIDAIAIPIKKIIPKIPDKLAKVIDTALMEDPDIGIRTAMELKHEIKTALSL